MFLTFATSFVTDRVRTAYYVYVSHLAESTLPMCCINVILVYMGIESKEIDASQLELGKAGPGR